MTIKQRSKLRRKRKSLGVSQTELAEKSGVSQSLIARIESEDIDPRLSTFSKIMKSLEKFRQENVTVASDIMSHPVICCKPEDKIIEVSKKMGDHDISQMPVTTENFQQGRIDEIIISTALSSSKNHKIGDLKVKKIMKSPYPTVQCNTKANEIIDLVKSVGAIVVKEEDEIVGCITKMDLLELIE